VSHTLPSDIRCLLYTVKAPNPFLPFRLWDIWGNWGWNFHSLCCCFSFYVFSVAKPTGKQGCQMGYFKTKNPNFGKFWRSLDWKMLIYFMAIWNILWSFGIGILRPFGIIYGRLVYVIVIWYIFPILVCLDEEKSGNPAWKSVQLSLKPKWRVFFSQ
jgi:hypothetical protein